MSYVRFYEKNPTVKKAVNLLFKFPFNVRSVLAKELCAIAESDFNAHVMIRDFKSLGKEKVLALYKSEQGRRHYDKDPNLSRAMNYLMILSPSDQFFLASRLMDLIHLVRDFMVICKKYGQGIQLALIERLTETYVRYGLNEAAETLEKVRVKYMHFFAAQNPAGNIYPIVPQRQSAQGLWESVSIEGSSLRLRLES